MVKKPQTKVIFKDGIVFINDEPKLSLSPSSKVGIEEYKGNIVIGVKNIGQFISPRYFLISEDGKVCQRLTANAIGEILKSTKSFVSRLKKLI